MLFVLLFCFVVGVLIFFFFFFFFKYDCCTYIQLKFKHANRGTFQLPRVCPEQ